MLDFELLRAFLPWPIAAVSTAPWSGRERILRSNGLLGKRD
jgi:hypothetical protein